ncbi:vacuolar protein sorting-associated protein 16 homolog [Anopheles stephensi]|uniref:vacuolar protein sorting-associated protein 16 homolog n=1 Tax=Anopheles stephensi TaxID=30069 RepID=UPI001658BD54|nr:vacuolar protein sorting-associated protein 16 homolog [Anopheles stephensi]
MSLLCNTGDWFTLGQGNAFRKVELYNMEWPASINLDNMVVYAAPYGGPIAIVKDPKLFIKLDGSTSTRPIIRVFNCVGKLLSSINWDCGNLVTLGWSDSEELIGVQDDGTIFIHDMFGNFVHKFSVGKDVTDVADAKIFTSASGTGVAVMTSGFKIYILNNIKDPKSRPLSELLNITSNLSCWEMVCKDRTTSCLLATGNEITLVRHGDNVFTNHTLTMRNEFHSISLLSVSFDHEHVAFLTNTGCLWMGSWDLKHKYCEFVTGRQEKANQLVWCVDGGSTKYESQAVIVSYMNLILIVGATGESSVYTYDSPMTLIPEMDCVRVLTNYYHELVQKVPLSTSKIFGINISEPASFLFEAHRKFQDRSHQSDEYLCLIQNKLPAAVADCIDAAGHEFDPNTQKSLIRAAYFGKSFIIGYNCSDYITMCKTLKVLNVLRDRNVGIPITIQQFNHLQPVVILDRLVFRKYYGLSIHIAKYLKLQETRILEHWAFQKIIHDKNDDEIARKIAAKFSSAGLHEPMSYANVADKAQQIGKTKLAITLLELETKKKLQVPLLLKLGASEKALIAATQSGDIDLIYMAILEMKNTTALAKFHMTIRRYPLAQNLYKKYCQLNSLSTLKDIHSQEDDFLSQAELALREALQLGNLDASIPDISGNYRKASKTIEADLADETKKLIRHQKLLQDKYQKDFFGLALHAMVRKLLQLGDQRYAEKLKSEFKMSDRRYWWLRIQTYAENYQWDELEKFAKAKKSVIGYEPFVEVCLSKANVAEAKKYLPRCSEENKLKWYLRAGCYADAATIAFMQKDIDSLLKIHDHCNDSSLMSTVENMIGQLSSKK